MEVGEHCREHSPGSSEELDLKAHVWPTLHGSGVEEVARDTRAALDAKTRLWLAMSHKEKQEFLNALRGSSDAQLNGIWRDEVTSRTERAGSEESRRSLASATFILQNEEVDRSNLRIWLDVASEAKRMRLESKRRDKLSRSNARIVELRTIFDARCVAHARAFQQTLTWIRDEKEHRTEQVASVFRCDARRMQSFMEAQAHQSLLLTEAAARVSPVGKERTFLSMFSTAARHVSEVQAVRQRFNAAHESLETQYLQVGIDGTGGQRTCWKSQPGLARNLL